MVAMVGKTSKIKVGEMFKFGRINGHTSEINNRIGIYLGEDFIHRDDGVTIENHKVLLNGDTSARIIDRGLVGWMERYEHESR